MRRLTLRLTSVLFCALAVACAKDKTPPPAPNVDPVISPTAQTTQTITGSAEYGAKIHVTGGAQAADTTADQFTARFRVTVSLKPNATNTLSLTATDAAGNVSAPATVTIVQAPPQVASLTVVPTISQTTAGTLIGLVVKAMDQYGEPITTAVPVSWSVSPSLAATFTIPGSSPAVTLPQGVIPSTSQFVAYDLSGVKASGYSFTLTATSGTVSGSTKVTVLPASGYAFSTLHWAPSGTTLNIAAGQDASYVYQVVDLYGNPTTGPETAYVNAPGAIVLDEGVSGKGTFSRLTTTGSYTGSFYIAGKGQQGALSLNIGNAPPASITVTSSGSIVPPNTNMYVTASVKDSYNNPIVCSTPGDVSFVATLSSGGTFSPTSVACFNGAFQATFKFSTQGSYSVTATYAPGGVSSGVTGSVYFNVLQFDTTPPTVSIANIKINGIPCNPSANTPAGCTVANNDFVSFDVSASDNVAVSEVSFSILFASTASNMGQTIFIPANTASTTVSFSFNVNTSAVETANLVASAVDSSGNRATSAGVNFYTTLGARPLGSRTLVALSSGNILNAPTDVVAIGSGDVVVANRGSNQLLDIPAAGSTMPTVLASVASPEFLARGIVPGSGAEMLYVNNTADGQVYSITPTGSGYAAFANPNNGTSRGLGIMTAMSAKGWADLTNAANGDTLTIAQGATTTTYQFTTTGTCTAGNVCVSVTAAATAAQKAAALVTAMGSDPLVTAQQYSPGGTPSGTDVFLAKVTGNNAAISMTLNVTSTIALSAPTLIEGHFDDLYVASSTDNNVRRYQLNTGPYNAATNSGSFTFGAPQFGLAVRDIWSAGPATDLQHLMLYGVPPGGGLGAIQAREIATTSAAGTVSTSSATSFTLSTTTDPTPITFNQVGDLALTSGGCLLASDVGRGNIYAINVTNPLNTTPTVLTVATGFTGPMGLAIDGSGNLLIADTGANTIYRLAPNAASGTCF